MISVAFSDIEGYEGWLVGAVLGDNSYGNIIRQEGSSLHGNIVPDYEDGEMIVTLTEEGEGGIMLTVDGGGTYHFTPMEMQTATILS